MTSIHRLLLVAAPVLLALGCLSPPVETPTNLVVQVQTLQPLDNPTRKIDILFMVDNSSSMTAMQTQLQKHFGDFLTAFSTLASQGVYADLHIGVVTSDYGAGDVANVQPGLPSCDASPGGQKGLLQVLPATYLGITGCAAPTNNVPYIEYSYDPTTGMNNLPGTQTLAQTFTCMASVGALGCGFEHQLESVYAALNKTNALSNGNGLNGDFLRADAVLAVVFVTNEDDASADPATHIYEPTGVQGQFGYYDTYRQTRWGVECTQSGALASTPYPMNLPTDAMGNPVPIDLTGDGCEGAPNAGPVPNTDRAYDISRYVEFFTKLKANPANVVLVGIDGPTTPFRVILAKQGTGLGAAPAPQFQLCDALSPPSCAARLDHSCQNIADPAFFADPPVRLSAVINNGATTGDEEPICGTDLNQEPDYTASMQKVAKKLTGLLSPGCIPGHLTNPTQPDCSAIDHDTLTGKQTTIPECNTGVTTTTPTYNGQLPCWIITAKPQCAPGMLNGSPDGLGMTIVRSAPAPVTTYAFVQCATIAQSADGGI